ncbi:clathrin light chain 2-like [Pyrus ussuriensis x Pyrus communis]|uniref:Clathrin light chain 2-like n=1 Tax=Pyrus ussuriensis x Pyrus communis TaxID=2448454 RepID=A0A5N5F0M9_9ROSA|nr:clathrin light chain 2-like [Pyrus ussuriensis x Pyrus communis]
MASFTQPEDDSVLATGSTRPFDDDSYLGTTRPVNWFRYDPRLSSHRFDSFVDSESLKDSATNSPIFHGSAVDDPFATQPVSEAFSPPSIYAELNGQGFDGRFGRSDDLILPAPSDGLALREWRR